MALRPLVIIGARGHAKSVAEAALSAGLFIECLVDEVNAVPPGAAWQGIPIRHSLEDLIANEGKAFAIAIGDNRAREAVFGRLSLELHEDQFPPIVHSSASVSRSSALECGTHILQGATVGADAHVGKFAIVNTNASIDHDSYLAEFSRLNPGAVVAGGVHIGVRSTIGMNASIADGVRVGMDVTVGANSFVRTSLPDGATAFGVPASPRSN